LGGGESRGDLARCIFRNIRAGAVLGNRVLKAQHLARLGMHRHAGFFPIQGFEITREPMLYGAIPLKEIGDDVHGTPFQEVLARQAVVAAPVRGRESDVAKSAGVEALSAEKSFGGGARLLG